MKIIFPHAGGDEISLCDFVAAWIHYCKSNFQRTDWQAFSMPILLVKEATAKSPGFDALCRILVDRTYAKTMQATEPFFSKNSQYVEKLGNGAINPRTGRPVNGVRLRKTAIREWESMQDGQRKKCRDGAERMLREAGA